MADKPLASRLRHRIDIQRPVRTQNSETGETVTTWESVWCGVPAEIAPSSAREFIASQSLQSDITARITIRWRDGVTADMRVKRGDTIYNIAGVLPDPHSGREWITLPVSTGVNEG